MKHNGKTIDLGLREGLEYFSTKYNTKEACTVSDRSPEKLSRLTLIGIKMSTPEQMLDAYNSLVDAYNKFNETKPVGEWVYADTIAGMRYYHCTNCAKTNDGLYKTLANENEVTWWRFCPRCGAKMFTKDGNKEEEE